MTLTDTEEELVGFTPIYRYYFVHLISAQLLAELPLSGVSWSRKIRKGGEFTGTYHVSPENVDIDSFWATMPGRTAVYVTRMGVPVWGGVIHGREYSPVSGELKIDAVSFEAWLYFRVIWSTVSYSNSVDQYQVVRNLLTLMQSDFLGVSIPADGVTEAPGAATINLEVEAGDSGKHQDTLTVNGRDLKSFGDVIETFSDNLNGFEYYVDVSMDPIDPNHFRQRLIFRDTPPSQLPAGDDYGGTRPGLDENWFEYPGNVLEIGFTDDLEQSATRYFVTGKTPETESGGSTALAMTPRGSWNNDPYLSTGWPIIEFVESSIHSEVSVQETLNGYALKYGRRARPPIATWQITVNGSMNPVVGTYRPGDWCRILSTDPFLRQRLLLDSESDTGVVKRIAEFSVSVPDTQHVPETVTLQLIDEWNDEGNV